MKKWMKILLILAVTGVVVGAGGVYYVFNMPHRDVENEKPAWITTAPALYRLFSRDEAAASKKYNNKVVQVSGKIVELTGDIYHINITLNEAMAPVSIVIDSLSIIKNVPFAKRLKLGDVVTVKGQLDGYDMIMGVVLTRGFFVNDN